MAAEDELRDKRSDACRVIGGARMLRSARELSRIVAILSDRVGACNGSARTLQTAWLSAGQMG